MPYQSAVHAQALKKALKNIRDDGTSTQRLLAQITFPPRVGISVSALNKWLATDDAKSKNAAALGVIYAFLKGSDLYRDYLKETALPGDAPRPAADAVLTELGAALARFLDDETVSPLFPAAAIAAPLAGDYVLYRTGWIGRGEEGRLRASKVSIEALGPQIRIREVQDYPQETPPHFQEDVGIMLPYGPWLYGFMRELHGTCVKLMVVTTIIRSSGATGAVRRFQGYYLAACPDRGVFPRLRFACCRYAGSEVPRFGSVGPEEVADYEAVLHLTQGGPPELTLDPFVPSPPRT